MEHSKSKINSLNGNKTIALLPLAGDVHIVQREMFQYLERPGRQHEPREDGVDEQDDRISYPGRHAVKTSAPS